MHDTDSKAYTYFEVVKSKEADVPKKNLMKVGLAL